MMSRTAWAELALRLFERLIWFEAWYWTVAAVWRSLGAAFFHVRGFDHDEFGESYDQLESDFIVYFLSAITLHGLAYHLRGQSSRSLDFSASRSRGDDELETDTPATNSLAETHRGAELLIVALVVVGTRLLLSASRHFGYSITWWRSLHEYDAFDYVLSQQPGTVANLLAPNVAEFAIGLALIFFSKPIALWLARPAPSVESDLASEA